MPHLVDSASLHPLGTYRGRPWYSHRLNGRQPVELEETRRVAEQVDQELEGGYRALSIDELPNGPIVQETADDGRHVFRVFRVHEPRTYERLTGTAPRVVQKRVAPSRRIDVLAALPDLRYTVGAREKQRRVVVRGVDRLRAFLAKKGTTTYTVGGALVIEGTGGELYHSHPHLLEATWPLLANPVCALCGGEAVTLARAYPHNLPWCGTDCTPKEKLA